MRGVLAGTSPLREVSHKFQFVAQPIFDGVAVVMVP
jgi:hypothetical protein